MSRGAQKPTPKKRKQPTRFDVFLSYNRSDRDRAQYLHDGLEHENFTAWWDAETEAGESWPDTLMDALQRSKHLVLLLSRNSVGSAAVKNEVLVAQDLKCTIIPIWYNQKDDLLSQNKETEQKPRGTYYLVRGIQRIDGWEPNDPLPPLIRRLRGERMHADQGDASDEPAFQTTPPDVLPRALPPPRASATSTRLTITLPGSLETFDELERLSFVALLARFAQIAPDQIVLERVVAGSVRLTLKMPESSARWLLEAYRQQADVVRILDITDVQLLPAAEPMKRQTLFTRLRVWLGSWPRPTLGLAGAGAALCAVLLALALSRFVTPAGPQQIALCGDLSVVAEQCAGASLPLFLPTTSTVRSPALDVPRVVTPRSARLLTLTPEVRWTPVEGATTYIVTLRSSADAPLWTTAVKGAAALSYPPEGAPPLVRGETYRFDVQSGSVEPENPTRLGFTVVTSADAAALEAEVRTLAANVDDPTVATVLTANLYAQRELYADALMLLEQLAPAERSAASELLRGGIYLQIGLPDLAQGAFEQAGLFAQAAGTPLTEGLAYEGRAESLLALGQFDRSRAAFEQARTSYEEAGDAQRAQAITDRIQMLP